GTAAARLQVTVRQATEYIPVGPGGALATRPNPFLGSTNSWYYMGTASYHAGNISLTKRSRGGLSFKTNYTFGKILDLNSGLLGPSADNEPQTLLNRFNPRLSRGDASYSIKHQFTANFSYAL